MYVLSRTIDPDFRWIPDFPRLGRGQLRPKGLRHRGGHRGEHILPRLPRLRHGAVGQEIRGGALAAVGTEGCLGAWRSG
jgi:hypothetical protein